VTEFSHYIPQFYGYVCAVMIFVFLTIVKKWLYVQTASPQDLSEVVSTKQKKSSGKGKPDSPKVESSTDLPVSTSDEFIPAPPKARGKKKPDSAVAKPRYELIFDFDRDIISLKWQNI